ncbi:MAG: glycerophosphodiester phosphodiesterase [Legionellaceae bacterium]|nr:glycerophosphodiester phosphodiesterase [Legionellaceae bacterium]
MLEPLIAHRGASAYAPENTIAAFDKAVVMGARMLEFDVMLSEDGEPFVIHDERLKRTSNGRGKVGEVSAEYLQSLDAGSWFSRQFKGEPIPHLKQVLQWLIFAGIQANIEIKPFPGTASQTAIAVMSCLNRFWPPNQTLPLISSFDWSVLQLCRRLAPETPLALLMHDWQQHWLAEAESLQVSSVHLNRKILTRERAQLIKSKGYQLAVYTVNRRRQAQKYFDWGVDAIFSDYPDLLK